MAPKVNRDNYQYSDNTGSKVPANGAQNTSKSESVWTRGKNKVKSYASRLKNSSLFEAKNPEVKTASAVDNTHEDVENKFYDYKLAIIKTEKDFIDYIRRALSDKLSPLNDKAVKELVENAAGIDVDFFVNSNIAPERKTKIAEDIINSIKEALKEGNDLDQIKTKAKEYYQAVHLGQWSSISDYKNSVKNSNEDIVARCKRVEINIDGENAMKEYVDKSYGAEARTKNDNKWDDKVNRGEKPCFDTKNKSWYAFMMQDMSKLIIASKGNPKELMKLAEVIKEFDDNEDLTKELGYNPKLTLFRLIYNNLDDKYKTEFADNILTDKKYRRVILGPKASRETHQGVVDACAEDAHEESVDSYHEQNIKDRNRLAELEAKTSRTQEEENELAELRNEKPELEGGAAGLLSGALRNKRINQEKALHYIEESTSLSDSREIITLVQEYVEKEPSALHIDLNKFIELMDEGTNGNYSIVKNDRANGTTTPLNPPKYTYSNNNSGSSKSVSSNEKSGTSDTEIQVNNDSEQIVTTETVTTEQITATDNNSSSNTAEANKEQSQKSGEAAEDTARASADSERSEASTPVSTSGQLTAGDVQNTESFIVAIIRHGVEKVVGMALNTLKACEQAVKVRVKDLYTSLSASRQSNMITSNILNREGFVNALAWAKDAAVIRSEGHICSSHDATAMLDDKVEEYKKSHKIQDESIFLA